YFSSPEVSRFRRSDCEEVLVDN
nr:hypothetical protein [Tanacetum cinerariifolium]